MALVADNTGVIEGKFRIPPHITAGAKTVTFSGSEGGTTGSAVFIGQGTLTVETLRQVHTVTNVWVDPLAQTFVLDEVKQLCGVDLWFTKSGGDARGQIREVANGFPSRVILAEAKVPKEKMVITGGGHTRILFPSVLTLNASQEYALVILCDDAETSVAIAEMTKFDAVHQKWVAAQPYNVGVLLSSSNASTWTAHQDRDLTFRLLEPVFASGTHTVALGNVQVTDATDLMLLTLADSPSARTRVEYNLTMPSGEVMTVADGQTVRLAAPVTGAVGVNARLNGEERMGATLYPGTQLLAGKVGQSGDYYTRSITAVNATRVNFIYDANIPSGAAVKAEIRIDAGEWQTMESKGTTQMGDGFVEFRFTTALSDATAVKARLTLTGTATARPRVRNIRLMALI